MKQLELKVPPVVVLLVAMTASYGLSALCEICHFQGLLLRIFAALVFLLSTIFAALSLLEFRKHRTTIWPHTPEKSSTLVTQGIFSYSRNPMYLSLFLLLLAESLWLGTGLSLLPLPLFILYMNQFQIKPEEQALFKRFGQNFTEYCQKTRRWL